MNITGPCIEKLSTHTNNLFLSRINEILNSGFLENIFTNFLEEYLDEEISIFDDLCVEDQNIILKLLENSQTNEKKDKILKKYKNYLKI